LTLPVPSASVIVRSMGRRSLERALDSIAHQDYPAVEVVMVGASGRSHAAFPASCGPFPVLAVRSDGALSRAEAASAGVRAATGDWVTFLDDDDELLGGHLAGLVASAAAHPARRAVTGRALARFRDGRTQPWGQRFALAELYLRNFVHLSTLLFHRSLLAEAIAFDRALPMHEDWDFALQIAQHTQFADWPHATFLWNVESGTSGAGGGGNVDDPAFARYRDHVYAKWAPVRGAFLERCERQMGIAVAAFEAGNATAAAAAATRVLDISQNDPHALNFLSMLALRQGDHALALERQLRAVEVRPHDPDLWCNLATVRWERNEVADARLALAEALRLDPSHRRAAAKLREIGG
jgi:tetratricopeptide (TPR) repeat protein